MRRRSGPTLISIFREDPMRLELQRAHLARSGAPSARRGRFSRQSSFAHVRVAEHAHITEESATPSRHLIQSLDTHSPSTRSLKRSNQNGWAAQLQIACDSRNDTPATAAFLQTSQSPRLRLEERRRVSFTSLALPSQSDQCSRLSCPTSRNPAVAESFMLRLGRNVLVVDLTFAAKPRHNGRQTSSDCGD